MRIERSAAEVFAWHERPEAFADLVPPWQQVQVVERQGGIRDGATVCLRVRLGPLWVSWDLEHRDYKAGVQFRDVQLRGPFAAWEHLHHMQALGPDTCLLTDRIAFALPLGRLGGFMGDALVRAQLERLFAFRHAATKSRIEGRAASPDCVA